MGKPFRTLTFGRLAESAGFQSRAGPVHSVGVLRVQVFILSKMEKFLLASDLGFVMIFSKLCESQHKPCLRGFLWMDDNRHRPAFKP